MGELPEAGVRVALPGRLNLLGNPGDANEGDFQVISAAVELRAELSLRPAAGRLAELDGATLELPETLPAPVQGPATPIIAALNGLVHHSPEAHEKLDGRGFALAFETAIPRGGGLGGSSVLVLAVLAAFRAWLGLDPRAHHLYRLAEWAQWSEEREVGVAGGYIDFYTPLFGGLLYVDFRGKLRHPPEGEGPFATVERLDELVPELPLVVASSGIAHRSGQVHGPMRSRYLEESERGEGALLEIMRGVGACAWRGKQALLRGDLPEVGRLLGENHALVDRMMRLCGFADGAGEANNALIEAAIDAGALGAKLTGAGGGGSILALAPPGAAASLEQRLGAALAELGLENGQVFRPGLAREGLVVRALPAEGDVDSRR
jgi:galactokinase/mevalonate kinase-like predicted kinase